MAKILLFTVNIVVFSITRDLDFAEHLLIFFIGN